MGSSGKQSLFKIAFVIPTLDQSGAERQLTLLATGLPRDEFQVEVIALNRGGPLAEELRVNRNTVAKVYGELEREGIIETLAGKGCFVCQPRSPLRRQVRMEMLTREIDQAVVAAHHLQIPRDNSIRLVFHRNGLLESFLRSPIWYH